MEYANLRNPQGRVNTSTNWESINDLAEYEVYMCLNSWVIPKILCDYLKHAKGLFSYFAVSYTMHCSHNLCNLPIPTDSLSSKIYGWTFYKFNLLLCNFLPVFVRL